MIKLILTTLTVFIVSTATVQATGIIQLPKTGQSVCYNNSGIIIDCFGTGQDGELQSGKSWPSPRFLDNGDKTVTDLLTGLFWTQNANPASSTKNWQAGLDYIKTLNILNYLGYSDWRLPNINELVSVVNWSQHPNNEWLNSLVFNSVQDQYWSSTSNSSSAWNLNMSDSLNSGPSNWSKNYAYYVWPVRGGPYWTLDNLKIISASNSIGNQLIRSVTSDVLIVQIYNTGNSTSTLTNIGFIGSDSENFSVAPGGFAPCSSLTPSLASGETCTIAVNVAPTSIGQKLANLNFTTINGSQDVPYNVNVYSSVAGTITDQATGLPLEGGIVTLNNNLVVKTDNLGKYDFAQLADATYGITVSKTGFQSISKSGLVVTSTSSAQADILLPTVGTLNITSTKLPWASPNVAYNNRVMITGGTAPYTFSKPSGAFPTGLFLDTTTGTISGTPAGTGSYTFAIGVTDNVSGYSEKEFTIELLPPLEITTISLPSGQQGGVYSSTIAATGGKTAYRFTLLSGALPSGLALATAGALSGTPREPGSFNITVRVTDATGRTYDKPYTVTMSAVAALTLNTTTLPQGYIGTIFTTTLSASGGVPTRTFSVTGTLPAGLSLNSTTGVISGTPSAAGLANYDFKVTDYSYPTAQSASVTLPLRIWNALSIATTSIPAGTQKTVYSTTLSGIGGVTPHTWSIATGILPQGITLDSTSGAIAGTPAICGAFPITARLTDAAVAPKNVDKALTLTVACSNDYIISGNAGVAGATVSYSGTASGSVTADGSGNYSIGPMLNGGYTVTPSKPSYVFTPASNVVAINNFDVSAPSFAGELYTPYTLNVMMSGNGGGSVHSSPWIGISCMSGSIADCSAKFGSVDITLTAAPDNATSSFSGWTNACVTPQKECVVSMTSNKTAEAIFILVPRTKLTQAASTGFDTLQTAYSNAATTIFALDGLFTGAWTLDQSKDISLKGGYLADFGPTRNGFTILGGKLTVKNGSLRVDRFKIGP